MAELLERWREALEDVGFDVADDTGAIVGRRQQGSTVKTLAVDQANRVLLTVTAPVSAPVSRAAQVLGRPASVVEEQSRTLAIRVEMPPGDDPAKVIQALLALAGRERTE